MQSTSSQAARSDAGSVTSPTASRYWKNFG